MTPLDRLRALHAVATPGVWHVYEPDTSWGTESRIVGDGWVVATCSAKPNPKRDADSISATHNALPSLLACVDALALAREVIAELRGYCGEMWDWKYGPRWDENAKIIDAALAPLVKEDP